MEVGPTQVEKLIHLLEILINRKYTLTGAADWQILQIVGGTMIFLFFGIIAAMWADLKATVKSDKTERITAMKQHEHDEERKFDDIWAEMRRCQDKCCDIGGRRKEDKEK